MRARITEHHFLHTKPFGRGSILTALPGQTLRGKDVSDMLCVTGCRHIRSGTPTGTVFGTTTLRKASAGYASFYAVEDLYRLDSDTPLGSKAKEQTRQKLKAEYEAFLKEHQK